MARFKPVHKGLKLLPGSFEFALCPNYKGPSAEPVDHDVGGAGEDCLVQASGRAAVLPAGESLIRIRMGIRKSLPYPKL
jgi:hypothetical protein